MNKIATALAVIVFIVIMIFATVTVAHNDADSKERCLKFGYDQYEYVNGSIYCLAACGSDQIVSLTDLENRQ